MCHFMLIALLFVLGDPLPQQEEQAAEQPAAETTPAPEDKAVPEPEPAREPESAPALAVPVASPAPVPVFDKSPAGATALSAIFPGIGHYYIGEVETGGALTGAAAVELSLVLVTLLDGWPEKGAGMESDPTQFLTLMWYQNTWLYGMYAAYRDTRLGLNNQGYNYPTPDESLTDLLAAPFDPQTLFKPEVGLGLIGWVGIGLLLSWVVEGNLTSPDGTFFERDRIRFMGEDMHPALGGILGEAYYMGLMLPVGIGEEAFFRGVVQSGLSESMGKWGGWAAASAIFGAVHAPNAMMMEDRDVQIRYLAIAVPYLMLSGGYLGWTYMHNNYSLRPPVALHFWYNFLLSTASFIMDPDAQPFAVRIAIPF